MARSPLMILRPMVGLSTSFSISSHVKNSMLFRLREPAIVPGRPGLPTDYNWRIVSRRVGMVRPLIAFALLVWPAIAAEPGIWKVAPLPPASWQRDRAADLAARRKAAAEQIGDRGILILWAAEPRNYAGDIDWPYRQENGLYYLTSIAQEGSALVMIPGGNGPHEILFLPPSNPAQETWTGHILTAEEGRKISGIETVWDARLLNQFLSVLLPQASAMFPAPAAAGRGGRSGRGPAPPPALPDLRPSFGGIMDAIAKGEAQLYMVSQGHAAEYPRELEFAAKLPTYYPTLKVNNAARMLGNLRTVKSPREIDLLQHAVEITAEAFQRAYAVAVPGTSEHEIQAQFEFTFLRRNAHWGYPCIVASGVNATTLHYESNQDTMKTGDLLLMDDAAEFDGYSVDITRTIPVSGKYSKEQAAIYRLVWEAQQAGIDAARPGHTGSDVTAAANKVFRDGLYKLGLITDPNSDQQVRVWFIHGITHGIGLNVHDPGGRELQPGMAITMEPGLYIRTDALDNLPQTEEN